MAPIYVKQTLVPKRGQLAPSGGVPYLPTERMWVFAFPLCTMGEVWWPPPHNGSNSPMAHKGSHTHILHIGKYGPTQQVPAPPFVTSVCQTQIGTIYDKYALVNITSPIDLKPLQLGYGESLSNNYSTNILFKQLGILSNMDVNRMRNLHL